MCESKECTECVTPKCDPLAGTMLGEMKGLVDGIAEDYLKAKGGGKLASTRCRKAMLRVKTLALDIRKEMIACRPDKKE